MAAKPPTGPNPNDFLVTPNPVLGYATEGVYLEEVSGYRDSDEFGPGPRISDDVATVGLFNVGPQFNESPDLSIVPNTIPDHLRYSSTPGTPWAHRQYQYTYFAPLIWQADNFSAGKLEWDSPIATTQVGGMIPDSPQRANTLQPQPSSYGDLVTLSLDGSPAWAGF